ncbi:MAG: hypothetical protein HW381_1551, partial [Candidatus Rokubacteria bacterium]|nr:hypothetical protein [Candidatus Rokubacteria bacterium]
MLSQPVPDETTGALERLEGLGPLFLRPKDGDVDTGELQVGRRVHLRHGHEAQPRILDLTLEDGGDLLLDELVDPLEPLPLHALGAHRRKILARA